MLSVSTLGRLLTLFEDVHTNSASMPMTIMDIDPTEIITTPPTELFTLTVVVSTVMTGLAAVFVSARIYSRARLERSMGKDDCK